MTAAPPVYLDYNATTPLSPEVKEAIRTALDQAHGNPSSGHLFGRRAKEALEAARAKVAAGIGARPSEVVFTSGGSESNNHALNGVLFARQAERARLVISAVEHASVSATAAWLGRFGFTTTVLGVDGTGRVDPAAAAAAIGPDVALVSVMHAQNEVGTIQPIAEIARSARAAGALVHTDAAQSMGKIPVRVDDLGVDLLTIAGHKLHAPKGIGALYVREGTPLLRFIHGAKQEAGRRGGTENVLFAIALGVAVERATADLAARAARMAALTNRLWERLSARVPGLSRNGRPDACLPNTLSVSFPGCEANALLAAAPGVAASAGAACHTGMVEVSGVLAAMGTPRERALGTIRLSTGVDLTEPEIDRAVDALAAAAHSARSRDPHA